MVTLKIWSYWFPSAIVNREEARENGYGICTVSWVPNSAYVWRLRRTGWTGTLSQNRAWPVYSTRLHSGQIARVRPRTVALRCLQAIELRPQMMMGNAESAR